MCPCSGLQLPGQVFADGRAVGRAHLLEGFVGLDLGVDRLGVAELAEAVDAVKSSDQSIGLIASFAPTLVSMPPEFPATVSLQTALVEDAMRALNAGDGAAHDASVVAAAQRLKANGAGVIALAQFSMARAAAAVGAATGLPVLTTPASAIRLLKWRLGVL